ncbi:MAG: protein-disulfide reductase DsbD family protein [Fidelibacterota bacterium]
MKFEPRALFLKISSFLLLIPVLLQAQFSDPVTVTAEAESPARAGEVIDVRITTAMDEEWHVYAVYGVSGGPIASRFEVTGAAVEEIGAAREPDPKVIFDEGFEIETRIHPGNTTFTVPVKLKGDLTPGDYTLTAKAFYQVCNNSMCFPPKEVSVPVSVTIEPGAPRDDHLEIAAAVSEEKTSGSLEFDAAVQKGILSFILLSLTMGFLALLTPCVFPMIPITVSFFTHQGEIEGRNPVKQALVYTVGIIATFSILGLLLAVFLGASGANQLAANPWVNLFIGGLFIYFALSLFGMYEIQLPSGLRQFALKNESRTGYVGILFMALTFTLTSFTCTVQFMGLLLVAASQGQWFWPVLGMAVFSTAFALPFFFLALFPQYLAKMPKSGGWLNAVKVIMGFLELAAALKFLSNTDLVLGWGIFTHISVLAVWTMIMVFAGIYLLGKLRLPHDSPLESIGVGRMLLSLLFLTFGLYLGTGLFGRPIHGLIYSYLPPSLENGQVASPGLADSGTALEWLNDLDSGLAKAKTTGKPVFIDFTGYTCTNCRWMESNIFTDPAVIDRFRQFVLVRLYTDGGDNYREKQRYEIERFGTAALPFYVILSPDNEEIARFPGLTRDLDQFLDFLDMGLIY